MEQYHLSRFRADEVRAGIKASIEHLKRQLKEIERMINDGIETSPI